MLDVALRLGLAPVLAAQGWRARNGARQLAEPEGPREGTVGQGALLRLLITGDSSAAGVGVDHQRQALSGRLTTRLAQDYALTWRLSARCGDTTVMTTDRLAREEGTYDIAVTALGVNDITRQVPLGRWLRQQTALFDLLQGRFGARHVLVSGMPPIRSFPLLPQPLRGVLALQADRYDRALRGLLAARDGCQYVQLAKGLAVDVMSPDGFHPGPLVYDEWAAIVAAQITQTLDDERHA